MKKVLGKKQRISNISWQDAVEHIEEYVSKKGMDVIQSHARMPWRRWVCK